MGGCIDMNRWVDGWVVCEWMSGKRVDGVGGWMEDGWATEYE